MDLVPPLLTFLLMLVSGWAPPPAYRYRISENRVLKERLRGKRIRFTDAEQTLLARKGQGRRTQSSAQARYDCFSGYAAALASALCGAEEGFRASTRSRAAAGHAPDLGFDLPRGAGQLGLGLYASPRCPGQSWP